MTQIAMPARTEDASASNLFERLVDRAVASGDDRSRKQVERVVRRHPRASAADVVTILEHRYRRRVKTLSAAVGLTAAVPGVGTGIAAVLTAANVGTFLRMSTTFVGSVARVHGVPVEDADRRRTLVLGALLGEDGARAVTGNLGVSSLYWGRGVLGRLPLGTVRAVNKGLSRRLVRSATERTGALLLGRLAPFGVGAVVGWMLGRGLSNQVVTGVRAALGPVPAGQSMN